MVRRRTRRLRRRRTMRGGAGVYVDPSKIPWPAKSGCQDDVKKVVIPAGTFIDRFGPETGFFVSPIEKYQFTYSERSLPWLGLDKNGNIKNKTRKERYNIEYRKSNPQDDNYHIYEVIQDITAAQRNIN